LRRVLMLSSAIPLRVYLHASSSSDHVVSNLSSACRNFTRTSAQTPGTRFCPFISQHSAPNTVRVTRFFTALDARSGKAARCSGGSHTPCRIRLCKKLCARCEGSSPSSLSVTKETRTMKHTFDLKQPLFFRCTHSFHYRRQLSRYPFGIHSPVSLLHSPTMFVPQPDFPVSISLRHPRMSI